LLVIDNLEDPQNLGQIIRTAECANISGILLPEHQCVQLTNAVLQVSQGAFVHLPIYSCGNLHQQLRALKKEGFWIIGVENSVNAVSWHELDYNRNLVLVMGSEGKGIRQVIVKTCDELITIPMQGQLNSLNVSSATSAILFERQRQLSQKITSVTR
jgi:23S rRNA (guanosine2251-2'-O)-methyltransferase